MESIPKTQSAKTGEGAHVAYQVVGEGPVDLVFLHGWMTHIEAQWSGVAWSRFLRRLASFSRVVMFDKQGTGLSDPLPMDHRATMEGWMEDMRTVLREVGSERVALLGASDGGPLAMLFAATWPEQTASLVLLNSFAGLSRTPERPWGMPPAAIGVAVDRAAQQWADDAGALDVFAPNMADDRQFREWWSSYARLCASPGVYKATLRTMLEADVGPILGTIRVPTLVIHRQGDRFASVENGRQLAETIPDARYVELPGDDHLYFVGDVDPILDEMEEFLTGMRHASDPDRVLATVLFSDIVGSTAQVTALGDRQWRDRLDAHDAMVRRQLERFRGKEIKTTGDGFVATFDGPARAIHCGCAIRDGARQLGIDVRVGLHTGEMEVRGADIGGIAVHIGSRVAALAGAGDVFVSSTVKDLVVGSGIEFGDRGEHQLKGISGTWRLFAVQS